MVFALRRLPASALALTSAGVLAASSLLLLAPAGAATAPATPESATAPVPVGLFGSADPTYDGVFRQSLSLLAFVAAGQTPPSDAVTWLLEQQCADGGFEPFRADVAVACTASDPVNYTGEDTNSSGLAAAALIAVCYVYRALIFSAGERSANCLPNSKPLICGITTSVTSR